MLLIIKGLLLMVKFFVCMVDSHQKSKQLTKSEPLIDIWKFLMMDLMQIWSGPIQIISILGSCPTGKFFNQNRL